MIRRPTRTPRIGLEKLVSISINFGSSLRGAIEPDIMLIPYIRTAKPIMIPPTFLEEVFLANIHRMIPKRATTPVSTSVLK